FPLTKCQLLTGRDGAHEAHEGLVVAADEEAGVAEAEADTPHELAAARSNVSACHVPIWLEIELRARGRIEARQIHVCVELGPRRNAPIREAERREIREPLLRVKRRDLVGAEICRHPHEARLLVEKCCGCGLRERATVTSDLYELHEIPLAKCQLLTGRDGAHEAHERPVAVAVEVDGAAVAEAD